MTKIRPVSDLRNKYPEIEEEVKSGEPIFLTKNGYGSSVVMSIESYDRLTNNIEAEAVKCPSLLKRDYSYYWFSGGTT